MPDAPLDPEEMKQQCIFCQIVDGRVASKKVYEDDRVVAILDINPANPGHVLILPKEHHSIVPLMPATDVKHLFIVAKKISKAQIRGLGVSGTNLFVANGSVAGQKSPHIMLHVIPRKEGDGVSAFNILHNQITPEDQEKLRVAIKRQVNAQFGINDPIVGEPTDGEGEDTNDAPPPPRPVEDSADEPMEKEKEESSGVDKELEELEAEKDEVESRVEEEDKELEEHEVPTPPPDEPNKGFNLDSISNLFK